MLLSRSMSLLSMTMQTLIRLCWPFRVTATHRLLMLLSTHAYQKWFKEMRKMFPKVKLYSPQRDRSPNPKGKQFESPLGNGLIASLEKKSPLDNLGTLSTTRRNTMALSSTQRKGSFFDAKTDDEITFGSTEVEEEEEGPKSKERFTWFMGVRTDVFLENAAYNDLDVLTSDCLVVDIDSSTVR
jgi:hypothetical protein